MLHYSFSTWGSSEVGRTESSWELQRHSGWPLQSFDKLHLQDFSGLLGQEVTPVFLIPVVHPRRRHGRTSIPSSPRFFFQERSVLMNRGLECAAVCPTWVCRVDFGAWISHSECLAWVWPSHTADKPSFLRENMSLDAIITHEKIENYFPHNFQPLLLGVCKLLPEQSMESTEQWLQNGS